MAGLSQRALVGFAALLFGLVVVVVLGVWLGSGGGSKKSSGVTAGSSLTTPPPPPRGALVQAAEAGDLAVALAVGRSPARLTATVLSGSGGAESGLKVRFRVGDHVLGSSPCGAGCYRAGVPAGASTSRVEVLLPHHEAAFVLPDTNRSASRIVSSATRVFTGLHSLVYTESLRSDPTHGVFTTWTEEAPNRLAYRIRGGASAVVIGRTRWDRNTPTARWVRSAQIPALQVPLPSWGTSFSNAYLLGSGRVDGRPVWIASFATPAVPAWFTAWIDKRSYRTLQLRMTAAAHFMFHRYLRFNGPVRITPP